MHCYCLFPAVSISAVYVCFKYLFHGLTFLTFLCLGKYCSIHLFQNQMHFSHMSCGVCACVCLWGYVWQSFALLQYVSWDDRYHSHAAIIQMVNRKSGNYIISCRRAWSKPYVFSCSSQSHCFVLKKSDSIVFLPGMTSKRNFPPSSLLVGCSDTLFPGKKMAPCGK